MFLIYFVVILFSFIADFRLLKRIGAGEQSILRYLSAHSVELKFESVFSCLLDMEQIGEQFELFSIIIGD
jgi:hypothetical protein